MSRSLQTKAALFAVLIAAAWVGPPTSGWPGLGPLRVASMTFDAFKAGLLIFGVLNVLLDVRGTAGVRLAAIAATSAALLFPELQRTVALLAWLVWPPVFMLAWALRDKPIDAPVAGHPEGDATAARARMAVAALIAAVAIASLAYRLLAAGGLQQTAALFVGLPALIAIVVVFSVSPRSATGVAFKAVTVGLLVSLLFLGEGILCVAMSAPLFYLITGAIAFTRRKKPSNVSFYCVALAMIPLSLEGVTGFTTLNRDESIAVTKIVRASPQAIERGLFEPPRFDRALPLYLRAGFPSAIATSIEHGAGGMRWTIRLRGGEMRLDGMEPRTGDLVLALEESRPGFIRWRAVSDSSHMTHFLTWREIVVEWDALDAETSNVTWTLRYRRGLDPAWYFGPMERYAVRLAAGYLIDTVATP